MVQNVSSKDRSNLRGIAASQLPCSMHEVTYQEIQQDRLPSRPDAEATRLSPATLQVRPDSSAPRLQAHFLSEEAAAAAVEDARAAEAVEDPRAWPIQTAAAPTRMVPVATAPAPAVPGAPSEAPEPAGQGDVALARPDTPSLQGATLCNLQ